MVESGDTDAGTQEPVDYGSRSESDDGSANLEAEGELSTSKPPKNRKPAGAATYKNKFKDA